MVLYIVHNKSNGLTKIGITEDLRRRINQIDRSCGARVDLVSWAVIDHAESMEKFLHATFDAYRVLGEWFALDMEAKDFLIHLWVEYFGYFVNKKTTVFSYKVPTTWCAPYGTDDTQRIDFDIEYVS